MTSCIRRAPCSGISRVGLRFVHSTGRVAAVAAVVCTLPAPALAFRTSADIELLADTERIRHSTRTIEVELVSDIPPSLELATVEGELEAALNTWSRLECFDSELVYTGRTAGAASAGDGKNTIQWIDDWGQRGFDTSAPGATDVQYAHTDDQGWRIAEADIYLNPKFLWAKDRAPGSDERELRAVFTHEIGHLLGLLHPCELEDFGDVPVCGDADGFSQTAMHPVYRDTQRRLADDDEAGVCFLYGDEDQHADPDSVASDFADGENGPSSCDLDGGVCLSAFGGACESSDDCEGQAPCVTEQGASAVCTRTCGDGLQACPAGWNCETVSNEKSVCFPASSGSCTAAARSRQRSPTWGLLMLLMVGLTETRRILKEKRR